MTTALGSSAHDWLVSLRRGGKGSAIDFFEIDFIGKGERERRRGGGVCRLQREPAAPSLGDGGRMQMELFPFVK